MLVIVQHSLTDLPTAFARGEALKRGDGAPEGGRVLQFFPSRDGSRVTCLWEGGSPEEIQAYVDETLGDASVNVCYGVDESAAFAAVPTGLPGTPSAVV